MFFRKVSIYWCHDPEDKRQYLRSRENQKIRIPIDYRLLTRQFPPVRLQTYRNQYL